MFVWLQLTFALEHEKERKPIQRKRDHLSYHVGFLIDIFVHMLFLLKNVIPCFFQKLIINFEINVTIYDGC